MAEIPTGGAHYEIEFHGPDNCDQIIHDNHVLQAYDHSDEQGNKLVYAHIIPRGEESTGVTNGPGGDEEDDDADEDERSLFIPPTTKGATRASSRRMAKSFNAKKRKPSVKYRDPADIPDLDYSDDDETDDTAKPKLIRLGTYPWSAMNKRNDDVENENDVELEAIMAAQVKTKINKMCFVLISSWTINSVQLGHSSMPELYTKVLFDDDGKSLLWKPDKPFGDCTNMEDVKRKVISFVNGTDHSLSLPIKPVQEYEGEPNGLNRTSRQRGRGSREDVHAVVVFRNRTGFDVDLDLQCNLQVALEHDETYDSFEEYIYNGGAEGDEFPGLVAPLSKKFKGSWQVGIWVMPQIRGTETMYAWTRLNDWVASDWLDAGLEEDFGRGLYIEVHIAPTPLEPFPAPLTTNLELIGTDKETNAKANKGTAKKTGVKGKNSLPVAGGTKAKKRVKTS